MKTCSKCKVKFKTLVVIDGFERNLGNRKYCLVCSPWGSHNTTTIGDIKPQPGHKICPHCSKEFPNTLQYFYPRYDAGKTLSTYCRSCWSVYRIQKFRDLKRQCIEYKGGKCQKCGYNKCDAAMDFHHTDPNKKELGIGNGRYFRFEKLKKELDKCKLLCSNCHREEHYMGL